MHRLCFFTMVDCICTSPGAFDNCGGSVAYRYYRDHCELCVSKEEKVMGSVIFGMFMVFIYAFSGSISFIMGLLAAAALGSFLAIVILFTYEILTKGKDDGKKR